MASVQYSGKIKIPPTFTKEKGIQLQDDLIAVYQEEAFQKKLRAAWKKAGGDKAKQLEFRQELMIEAGGPIVAKYGFENSRKGIHESKMAFKINKWGLDNMVTERFQRTNYLLDPDLSSMIEFKAVRAPRAFDMKPEDAARYRVPEEKKENDFQPSIRMSREKAIAMQNDLIAGFNTDEFRSMLLVTWKTRETFHQAYRDHCMREMMLEVQGPIMEKYGFEWSFAGVVSSMQSINYLAKVLKDEEVERNSDYMTFLTDPIKQMKFKDRKLCTLKVVSEDMKPLCTLEFDIAATFRYAKERIQGITSIPWQAQKLNLVKDVTSADADDDAEAGQSAEADAEAGVDADAQANTGQSTTAFQPPARATSETAAAIDDSDSDDPFGPYKEETEPVAAEEVVTREAEVVKDEKQAESVAAEEKQRQSGLKASPLSESIGELHDWELVSATIPVGRSAEIVLVQRSTTVLERLNKLCPVAPKAKGKAKKMPTKKEILDGMVETVRSFPKEVFSDLDFLIPAVQLSTLAIKAVLRVAPAEVRANRIVISTAVQLSGQALQFASDELQDDHQLVSAAVGSDGWNLQFASERLQANRELVASAIESDGWAFQYAAPDVQKDVDLATAALGRCGWLITSLDEEMQNNIALVKRAVWKDPAVLADLSSSMKATREVVLEAVSRSGLVLEHAADELQSDREIVLAAVKNCGMAIQFAHPKMKGVRDIGLAAVRQDGSVLMILEKWLQEDMEVVLIAIKHDFSLIKQIKGDLKMKVCAELGIEAGKVASYEEAAAKAEKARADAVELEAVAKANEIQAQLDILGLPAGTTDPKTIKQQFRRLALTHHPDKNQDDPEGAKNRMVSINHAYDTIARLMEL